MFKFLRRWFSEKPDKTKFPYNMKEDRHIWRVYRFHGGGTLTTPFEMSEDEACKWVAEVVRGEVAYVDREMGFIFYRPKE